MRSNETKVKLFGINAAHQVGRGTLGSKEVEA